MLVARMRSPDPRGSWTQDVVNPSYWSPRPFAGDRQAASELLDRAEQLAAEHPSYSGSAWVELTRAMLKSGALGIC